jgi:hypothetical protein
MWDLHTWERDVLVKKPAGTAVSRNGEALPPGRRPALQSAIVSIALYRVVARRGAAARAPRIRLIGIL